MAFEALHSDFTFVAEADLSASQYMFVTVTATGGVVLSGAGETAIGILQNDPTLGQAATVRVAGISQVSVGALIATGAQVEVDLNGEAITQAAAACMGIMLLGAANAHEIGTILIDRSFAPY